LRSADLYYDMREELPDQAQYCVALAFRIRYVMQMNAREAMHLIELRSGPRVTPVTVEWPRRWLGSSETSLGTTPLPTP